MTDIPPADATQPGVQPDARPQFRALMQYVKDSSFENPGAPMSLRANLPQPQIALNVDLSARRLDDNTDEVAMRIRATATRGEETAFIAELLYAGVFAFMNIAEDERQIFHAIECPRLLFPFARQILASMTQDGGFPAVVLEPIDFASLYRARLQQQQAQAEAGAGETPPQPN